MKSTKWAVFVSDMFSRRCTSSSQPVCAQIYLDCDILKYRPSCDAYQFEEGIMQFIGSFTCDMGLLSTYKATIGRLIVSLVPECHESKVSSII